MQLDLATVLKNLTAYVFVGYAYLALLGSGYNYFYYSYFDIDPFSYMTLSYLFLSPLSHAVWYILIYVNIYFLGKAIKFCLEDLWRIIPDPENNNSKKSDLISRRIKVFFKWLYIAIKSSFLTLMIIAYLKWEFSQYFILMSFFLWCMVSYKIFQLENIDRHVKEIAQVALTVLMITFAAGFGKAFLIFNLGSDKVKINENYNVQYSFIGKIDDYSFFMDHDKRISILKDVKSIQFVDAVTHED